MPPGASGADPSVVGPYMFSLMQRNIATSGFVAADHNASVLPPAPGGFTTPGCILASPSWSVDGYSYPGNVAPIAYDYAFNWTRDAAITVSVVLSQAPVQIPQEAATGILANYVYFAQTCQASGNIGQAKYTPEGGATDASDESDGPALRVLTILQGFADLDSQTQNVARNVITADLNYLLSNSQYQNPTVTLWEDTYGQSIFARAVQLRCLNQIIALGSGLDIPVPPTAQSAATWLAQQLPSHWSSSSEFYVSVLDPIRLTGDPGAPYDPAIDPIMASLYGDGISFSDPKLLSTASHVRAQWTAGGAAPYPINAVDASNKRGPMVGRYLGDEYDGLSLTSDTGHPWAVCTCSLAQLYYELADSINNGTPVPNDPLAATFFSQIGVTTSDPAPQVIVALRNAGDSMLNAVIYHSNKLELSEQFDQASGYEKSVSNLTWSYAAFLLAIAAR
jgi:glucoamylase